MAGKKADFQFYYFNAEGRGEVCRLLLAASGQKWDDVRFTGDDWPKYKEMAPFGQAPFLIYKGQSFGQSVAIGNFLAREFGFTSSKSVEILRNDEVVQLVQDFMQLMAKTYYEKDETKKAELRETLVTTDAPKFYGIFQKLLTDNGNTGHFVGKTLSHADLAVYNVINTMQSFLKPDFEADYPALKTLRQKVEGHEHLKKYLDDKKAKQQAKA